MKTAKDAIKQIGLRIEKRREEFSMGNYQLADMCLVSPTYIAEVEWGARLPSLPVLKRISKALQMPPEEILTGKRAHPVYYADKRTLGRVEKALRFLKPFTFVYINRKN